jgi:hypothetical protein
VVGDAGAQRSAIASLCASERERTNGSASKTRTTCTNSAIVRHFSCAPERLRTAPCVFELQTRLSALSDPAFRGRACDAARAVEHDHPAE